MSRRWRSRPAPGCPVRTCVACGCSGTNSGHGSPGASSSTSASAAITLTTRFPCCRSTVCGRDGGLTAACRRPGGPKATRSRFPRAADPRDPRGTRGVRRARRAGRGGGRGGVADACPAAVVRRGMAGLPHQRLSHRCRYRFVRHLEDGQRAAVTGLARGREAGGRRRREHRKGPAAAADHRTGRAVAGHLCPGPLVAVTARGHDRRRPADDQRRTARLRDAGEVLPAGGHLRGGRGVPVAARAPYRGLRRFAVAGAAGHGGVRRHGRHLPVRPCAPAACGHAGRQPGAARPPLPPGPRGRIGAGRRHRAPTSCCSSCRRTI